MRDFSFGLYFFFFQAEDGIRDLVRSRGLGDVYKRQIIHATELYAIESFGMPANNIERNGISGMERK